MNDKLNELAKKLHEISKKIFELQQNNNELNRKWIEAIGEIKNLKQNYEEQIHLLETRNTETKAKLEYYENAIRELVNHLPSESNH